MFFYETQGKYVFLFLQISQKLIVMISLSIHMMTRQDRIYVQCVTNGLKLNRS